MHERQWMMSNPFMWVIVPFVLIVLGIAVAEMVRDRANFEWPILLAVAAVVAVLAGYLRIRVSGADLILTWFPFWRRRIPLGDIEQVRPVPYKFRDFGGWGLRWNRRAVAYSVWSKQAIRLKVVGKSHDVVFTTKHQQEWIDVLHQAGIEVHQESET